MQDIKKFCAELARASSKIITQYYRTSIKIETKADASPVTIADKKAEEIMRELIMKEFPEHGILGEEFGVHNENSEHQWILDPIDGTKSFICGTPLFGTLIAYLKDNNPVVGVIHLPVLSQYLLGDNKSAELNGNKVNTRACENLDDAVLLTSDHFMIAKYQNLKKFEELAKKVKLYRNWGDCYGYYLLASGYADIMIDPIMSRWDSMALIPIVKGAGGIITDYQGNDPVVGTSIIVAGKGIHNKIIEMLN